MGSKKLKYILIYYVNKKVKNIFFDISKSKNYIDENWKASHFSFS